MNPGTVSSQRRTHPALVVGGITIGILSLLFLQFAIPYFVGPFGLVVVGLLDLTIVISVRNRRLARKRSQRLPVIRWGPVDPRYVLHRRNRLGTEMAASAVLALFIAVVYAVGVAVRVEYWWIARDLTLYAVGSILTSIGIWFTFGFEWGRLPSESELFDTTEDH